MNSEGRPTMTKQAFQKKTTLQVNKHILLFENRKCFIKAYILERVFDFRGRQQRRRLEAGEMCFFEEINQKKLDGEKEYEKRTLVNAVGIRRAAVHCHDAFLQHILEGKRWEENGGGGVV